MFLITLEFLAYKSVPILIGFLLVLSVYYDAENFV